jgi:DNA-directed RNA polymerase specialized sigma24 family protein
MVEGVDGSFEEWYRREHPRMLAAVLFAVGNVELAREVVDEAFTKAFERWGRVSGFDYPVAWTYRVALNQANRLWRRARLERRARAASLQPPDVPPPAGEIWQIVESLSRRQRQVVVLRHIADLTEPEIADVLGISRGNVARVLHEAHARLGDLLAVVPKTDQAEVPHVEA